MLQECKIKPAFIQNLQVLIDEHQTSLKKISDKTDISYSQLWQWTHTTTAAMPSIAKLETLADFLGCSVSNLILDFDEYRVCDADRALLEKEKACPTLRGLLEKLLLVEEEYYNVLELVFTEIGKGRLKISIQA